jgi:OOP family OmpA-OmpF porin
MKKIFMLTVVIMLTFVVTAAQAEVKAGSVSFTPFAGYYFFEGNQDLKNSPTFGLRAGYNFTNNLGLEGFFSYTPTEIQTEGQWEPWQDVYSYGIEGLYHFMPEGRLVPFIAIGVGGIFYGKGYTYRNSSYGDYFEQSQYSVDYGAGLKFFLTDNIALRADVRHVLPLNSTKNNPDYVHNDFMATFGINFAFGGKKKENVEARVEEPAPPVEAVVAPKVEELVAPAAPVKVVLDSDNDGVPDNLDKCPNTPAGVAVDKNGCVPKKISIAIHIEFDTAKSVIKKKYHNTIKKLADFIKEYPDANVVIEGHTDNVDIYHEPERNVRLSKARANSVRQYLIDNFAINSSRITAVGYGPNRPIASNKTKKGRQKNRRSEIKAIVETTQIK